MSITNTIITFSLSLIARKYFSVSSDVRPHTFSIVFLSRVYYSPQRSKRPSGGAIMPLVSNGGTDRKSHIQTGAMMKFAIKLREKLGHGREQFKPRRGNSL
jgi:hypothetical protein